VLQCFAVCCSVLQCVSNMNKSHMNEFGRVGVNKWTSVVQCVVVCCSVLQCVAVCHSVLQCGAVCSSMMQCVAMSCNVLQCCHNTYE